MQMLIALCILEKMQLLMQKNCNGDLTEFGKKVCLKLLVSNELNETKERLGVMGFFAMAPLSFFWNTHVLIRYFGCERTVKVRFAVFHIVLSVNGDMTH